MQPEALFSKRTDFATRSAERQAKKEATNVLDGFFSTLINRLAILLITKGTRATLVLSGQLLLLLLGISRDLPLAGQRPTFRPSRRLSI